MAAYRSLEALADPTRRSIFESLRSGAQPVGEIARQVPISRPAVSQHLKVLKDAGLVTVHAAGTRRFYGVDPIGLEEIRRYFDEFWSHALRAYASAVGRSLKEAQQ